MSTQLLSLAKVGPAFNSIQKPARIDSDFIPVAADNSFSVTPKFAIHQRVLSIEDWAVIEIKNYTFEITGDPKKHGLTLLYVDSDGDTFYEDQLRSNLDECPGCGNLAVYKNECVVCVWPEEQMPDPSMSAYERNDHTGLGWK